MNEDHAPSVLDVVEQAAGQADSLLRPQRSVAFPLLTPKSEALGVVVELAVACDTVALARLTDRVRHAIRTGSGMDPVLVLVLWPDQIPPPPVSSEARGTIRLAALLETLSEAACWLAEGITRADLCCPIETPPPTASSIPSRTLAPAAVPSRPRTARSMERWIRSRLQEIKALPPEAADTAMTLEDLGFGSLAQLQLVRDLEQHFAIKIPPTAPWETGTIANLASFAFDLSQKTSPRE